MNPQAKMRPFQGLMWMVASTLAMVGVNGTVKHLGTDIPAAQAAFLRFVIGVPFFLPMVLPILRAQYPRLVWRLFLGRAAMHAVAVILWFYAMARVPVADMAAIGFLNPVVVLVIGGLIIGEGLPLRRVALALLACLGALIILRPGLREVTAGHMAQMGATFCFAASYIVVKRLSQLVPAGVTVAMLTFTMTLVLFPLALAVWQPVTPVQMLWLALAAGLATLGHYAMSRAFAAAPLAVTQPAGFLQLIWATLLGILAFGERFDLWVLMGGAVILGAFCVNTLAETRRRGAAVAAPEAMPPL